MCVYVLSASLQFEVNAAQLWRNHREGNEPVNRHWYKLLGKKTSKRTERGELCMSLSFVDQAEIAKVIVSHFMSGGFALQRLLASKTLLTLRPIVDFPSQVSDMQRNAVAKCFSMQDDDLDLADWKLRVMWRLLCPFTYSDKVIPSSFPLCLVQSFNYICRRLSCLRDEALIRAPIPYTRR
jgi:hypothetical protein